MSFLTVDPGDPLRRIVEGLIVDVYARAYGARIADFPGRLVALVDAAGTPLCAAGLRLGWEASFSGCYLDEPVEHVLQRRTGRSFAPARIMEVTTLAGTGHGHALGLIDRVGEIGRSLGMQCAVFTATAPLRRVLRRSGMDLAELVPARRERVVHPDAWGAYYDADPWVCAVDGAEPASRQRSGILSACAAATVALHA